VPFRPILNYDKPAEPAYTNLLQLVERCWHQDPAMRPDFIQINKEFMEISHGKYVNKPITTIVRIQEFGLVERACDRGLGQRWGPGAEPLVRGLGLSPDDAERHSLFSIPKGEQNLAHFKDFSVVLKLVQQSS